MKLYKKLAVFGGTFSPVHNGHLLAMRAYAAAVKPDVLYVIPTAVPPHKKREDDASDAQRLAMLHIAAESLQLPCKAVISDMEIVRGGKSYTVDTVCILREIADEVVIYCGTDMLLTLDKWYAYKRLLQMVTVAYMQREEDGRYADRIAEKSCSSQQNATRAISPCRRWQGRYPPAWFVTVCGVAKALQRLFQRG